jgi:hypothetical protein
MIGYSFQKRGHQNNGGMLGGKLPATVVLPALNPRAFNFLKVAANECIGAVSLARCDYRVVVNKWPVYRRHIMLVSTDLRPQVRSAAWAAVLLHNATRRRRSQRLPPVSPNPQVLLRADLAAAAAFMRASSLPCLFFNSWSAGASVNHFHFQAMDEAPPVVHLQTVAVAVSPAMATAGVGGGVQGGAALLRLRGFPAHHTVVRLLPEGGGGVGRGELRGAAGAATAGAEVSATEGEAAEGAESAFTEAAVGRLWALVRAMQRADQPHNLLFFRGLAVVVGRSRDPRRRGRFHAGCGGIDLGCNEFAGWFTAFTQEAFDEYDARAARLAMQECSEICVTPALPDSRARL